MLKWISIGLGVLTAYVLVRGRSAVRRDREYRRRIRAFLAERGVEVVEVRRASHITYGWPGYSITFDTSDKLEAFRASAAFEALIAEVQSMHAGDPSVGQAFDARMAVELETHSYFER